MSTINDGGPAFPVHDLGIHGTYGMSLRDWFAGMAMQAWLSGGARSAEIVVAESAYRYADAMLAAREAK